MRAVKRIRQEKVASPASIGERLDSFLTGFSWSKIIPDFFPSRSYLQKRILEGSVRVNGEVCRDKSYRVKSGDLIAIDAELHPDEFDSPPPEKHNIEIVYRDSDLIVIDKPPGITSHPVAGRLTGTVVNFLKNENIPAPITSHHLRPGIVHRLDKNTSGLMIIACTDKAASSLIDMIKKREVSRKYLAIVFGNPPTESGTIEIGIARNERDRKKMSVSRSEKAKSARTHWRVLKRYIGFSLVACELDTGRTHQIRVHLSHIGYPVAGDQVYGGRKAKDRIEIILKNLPKKDRENLKIVETLEKISEILTADDVHLLHATELSFPHPTTGQNLCFKANPHEKFKKVVTLLETLPHEVGK
ncbi:MAG: RluA family pseudouridine synthase [bacterium]